MRCKPGDLAIVVFADEHATSNIGKVIRVLSVWAHREHETYWAYEGALAYDRPFGWHKAGNRVPYVEDSCLRPIRPGDTIDPRLVAEDLRNRNKIVARRFDAAREKAQQLRDRFDSESA